LGSSDAIAFRPNHGCPPNVKWDDYLYYFDLKEAMFGLEA